MSSLRMLLISANLLAGTNLSAETDVVSAQDRNPAAYFETCRTITENQARLDCLKNLLSKASPGTAKTDAEVPASAWPLIRTPRPGGPDAVAVMRTADTTHSDPDLAGLMIRCSEKPGLEVLLALVRPIPPRSKRDVNIRSGGAPSTLKAEASLAGTALLLPIDAMIFTTGPWQKLEKLEVRIKDPEGDIHGVISLDGVKQALSELSASCSAG